MAIGTWNSPRCIGSGQRSVESGGSPSLSGRHLIEDHNCGSLPVFPANDIVGVALGVQSVLFVVYGEDVALLDRKSINR